MIVPVKIKKLGFCCFHLAIAAVCFYFSYTYWPSYRDNEYPLFTDLVVFLFFMPSFSVLMLSLPILASTVFIGKRRGIYLLAIALCIGAYVYMVSIALPFSFKGNLLLSSLGIMVSVIYFFYSVVYYKLVLQTPVTPEEA